MAALERGLARGLLGVPIPQPPDRSDLPLVERVQRYLRDPVTWKSLVFVALKFPLGVLSFGAVVALGWFALVLLFAPLIVLATTVTIFGWIVTSPVQAVPLLPARHPRRPARAAPQQRARLAVGAVRARDARPEHGPAARAGRRSARRPRPHHRRRRRRASPDRARPARRRAAAPRGAVADARDGRIAPEDRSRRRRAADRSGAGGGGPGREGAAHARQRHPPGAADRARARPGAGRARRPRAGADDRRRRARAAPPTADRVRRLLRHGRGAHERRQVRGRDVGERVADA